MSQEKEKVQAENDKLQYDLERVAIQNNKSQSALEKSQEEVARLQVRLVTKRLCCYTRNESAFYQYCRHLIHCRHRIRMYTEEKTKVAADVWGTDFIQFLAALAIYTEEKATGRRC